MVSIERDWDRVCVRVCELEISDVVAVETSGVRARSVRWSAMELSVGRRFDIVKSGRMENCNCGGCRIGQCDGFWG